MADQSNTWTEKYWDAVNQFYWGPQYIGLTSIPRSKWRISADTVSIPRDMTNPNGPLYRRTRSGEDYWDYVRRQEETFNHLFDIAFAILPGDVTSEIFEPYINAKERHTYTSLSGELWNRYGWSKSANITTPDAFFISEKAILAVELKFNAKTSRDQLAEYLMLFVSEELATGPRAELHLLYIFNSDPVRRFENQIGLRPEELGSQQFEWFRDAVRNGHVKTFINENEEQYKTVLDRIRVSCPAGVT